jgi:hypothetical protein
VHFLSSPIVTKARTIVGVWGEDFESASSLDEFGMKILYGFSARKSIVTANADFLMAADDGHAPVAFALG